MPVERPYRLEGTLLESCSCRTPCPCWIGADPDGERCDGFNAYSLTRGDVDGVDVGGCTFVRAFSIVGNVREPGSWREVLVVDSRATARQVDAICEAYGGACGGPLADLAKLVGERLGVERAEISYAVARGSGSVPAGALLHVTFSPFVGAGGRVTTLRDTLMASIP